MAIYRVTYRSMTASYGPRYFEADTEYEAKSRFRGSAFSRDEMSLMHATEVSSAEVSRALRDRDREND